MYLRDEVSKTTRIWQILVLKAKFYHFTTLGGGLHFTRAISFGKNIAEEEKSEKTQHT